MTFGRLITPRPTHCAGVFSCSSFAACIREFCLPGTTAIDVGANGGARTRTMAQAVGASGHVHAFEPDPRILRDMLVLLREEFPWVHLHPIALSDANGTLPFYLDKSTALSSLHVRPNQGMQVVEKIEMPVRRLDDVPEIATADRISLIKADVEGEELRFVAGAAATLRKHKPVVLLEIDWRHVFNATAVRSAAGDHERDVQQFLSRLRDNGYSVMDFFGEGVEHYDQHAWNVALVPDSCDRTLLAHIVRSATALFFSEHQDWSLYGVAKALENRNRGTFQNSGARVSDCDPRSSPGFEDRAGVATSFRESNPILTHRARAAAACDVHRLSPADAYRSQLASSDLSIDLKIVSGLCHPRIVGIAGQKQRHILGANIRKVGRGLSVGSDSYDVGRSDHVQSVQGALDVIFSEAERRIITAIAGRVGILFPHRNLPSGRSILCN